MEKRWKGKCGVCSSFERKCSLWFSSRHKNETNSSIYLGLLPPNSKRRHIFYRKVQLPSQYLNLSNQKIFHSILYRWFILFSKIFRSTIPKMSYWKKRVPIDCEISEILWISIIKNLFTRSLSLHRMLTCVCYTYVLSLFLVLDSKLLKFFLTLISLRIELFDLFFV